MPNRTNIEWTDYTSNPIAPVGGGWGCSKVSPGCDHCYAERLNKRMGNKRDFKGRWRFTLKERELAALYKLPAGSRVFLGDMTDIFHFDVPWEMLITLFETMGECSDLTFQLLTKRPGRMAYFANEILPCWGRAWPPNVWAGTSVESHKYAPRLDVLARVPALVRFVSVEPMLGPVDLRRWLVATPDHYRGRPGQRERLVDWMIVGGESGPGARPMHPDWARSLRDQCQTAGVPFFFKQWGEWVHPFGHGPFLLEAGPLQQELRVRPYKFQQMEDPFQVTMYRVGKKAAGALLDGREWREFPE